MAINQNHLFEELNGVKCSIVEKNVAPARVEFLRGILEYNGFTVVVVGSPPPKAAPATPAGAATVPDTGGATGSATGAEAGVVPAPLRLAPETFTVGVTDTLFNPVNAIFGRLLRTRDGHVVTLAYWQQKEKESHDEVPYFSR